MYKGLKKSCKNVRWKTSVSQFELNALKNTAIAIQEIESGKYKLSPYQEFEIFEPKRRHITATRIKDRQIQRSICDTTLYETITKSFIYDNCACQIGKGTQFAMERLKHHLGRFYRTHKSNDGYFLKCDIHHFFESIDHDILKEQLRQRIGDANLCKMVEDIVDSFGDKGIGLGSQVSQLIALMYLDKLDHYIKEELRIKHYVRYMDDFILIHEDRDYLRYCLKQIRAQLDDLRLTLNSKTAIHGLRRGVCFLNWKYILSTTGKVIMIQNKHRVAKKRRKIKAMLRKGVDVRRVLQSMIAHLSKGNTYKVIKELRCYVQTL